MSKDKKSDEVQDQAGTDRVVRRNEKDAAEIPVEAPETISAHPVKETVASEKQVITVDDQGEVEITGNAAAGEQTPGGVIPNPVGPQIPGNSENSENAENSGAPREVLFLKSPTGLFGLAYNVGETGTFESKQADEIVLSGYGTYADSENALDKGFEHSEKR